MNASSWKKWGSAWRYSALGALTFALVSSADVSPPMPVIDLSVGPIAVSAQAANIALALSVEFPTAGAAYRTSSYDHTQTYLGYWNAQACYEYFDENDTSALTGQYFRRTGSTYPANTSQTDATKNGYCNTGDTGVGTGYSGNLLNYAATSSIDLLRYALTGGDRVLDTASRTILARAFLPSDFKSGADLFRNNSYWPQKQVAGTLTGKVTPLFVTASGATNTNTIYLNSCDDVLFVGSDGTSGTCTSPASANSWATRTPSLTGTFSLEDWLTAPVDTTTTTYVLEGTRSWGHTPSANGDVTQTTIPTGNDVGGAGLLTADPVVPSPRNSTSIGTATTPQYTSDPVYTITFTVTTGTVSTVTSAEQAQGYPVVLVTTTYALNGGTAGTPFYEGLVNEVVAGAPLTISRAAISIRTCNAATGSVRLRINAPAGVTADRCNDNSTGNSSSGITTYRLYTATKQYRRYTPVSVYRYFQIVPAWYTPAIYTRYKVFSNGLTPARMRARVEVCAGSEATSRSDLCTRYPDGNYKPTGEVQLNAEGSRLAAFGYVMENSRLRHGGVLRAPMRFLGPQFRDATGTMQTNTSTEWDVNNGVFTTDPLGASPSFPRSGLINYLNKFGNTGVYKSFDPVGELYYEALRYYQGLSPTASAASGLTTAMYDNFQIYNNVVSGTSTVPGWTDPLQNACQRKNFILVIGDVNTHNDRMLPGHGGAMVTTEDPARGTQTLLGDATKVFDAPYWTSILTGFETNTSVSYTDAKGIARNTLGNPNPVATNTNLEGKGTGSGSNSAYYWAGAAYWANTQTIRWDSKGTPAQSMKDVRVKTFTIDVDEVGNGLIDGNTRGIKPRNSSFFLAGKYGWFNDANLDGNPFKTAGGLTNNQEWEDPDVPNTPDGYVIASQAQKMLDGIRKFFLAANSEKGAVSVSSLSSQRFTTQEPNGDLFAPRFDTRDWSGTVQRSGLRLNTTTDSIDTLAGVKWDAGAILRTASFAVSTVADPFVKPVDRKIYTQSRGVGTTTGQAFTVANKSNLDGTVLAALNKNPSTGVTDNKANERINWLRGSHADELTSTGGFLRRRTNIMGDVINSGPVFKQGADPDVRGPGYGDFAQTVNTRTAMIYVGANDGMMHAFRATDGKEMFAYIPRAVAEDLNKLTAPSYIHRPYVDGVPHVGEAQVGSTWKTILASGMGGGAQGVFALDVTSPTTFSESNVMFEFTDRDDPDMGNVLMQPKLVKMRIAGTTPTYKWFIAVGSGYNNYKPDGSYSSTGKQALFLLSVDKSPSAAWTLNTNYFKVVLADPASTSIPTGLTNPGFATGAAGEAIYLYSGDLQGNLWRFNFVNGLDATNAAAAVKISSGAPVPISISKDSSANLQPITTSPQVTSAPGKGYMVVFGTGKFMEPIDSGNGSVQTMYGIWDNLTSTATDFSIGRSKLFQRTMTAGTSTVTLSGSSTFVLGVGGGTPTTYRGWYVDMTLLTGERIATEGASGLGFVAYNSTVPDGTCSGDGTGRSMCFTPAYGTAACDFTLSDAGLLSRPNVVTLISDDVSEAYTTRASTGKRMTSARQALISTGTKITDAGNVGAITAKVNTPPLPSGRMSWREVRNFKDN